MKIGLLTFHYTTNQGSIMQAYCLYRYLVENFPQHEVKLIDLIPTSREIYELLFFEKKVPFISITKLMQYINHRRFIRDNFKRTKRFYSNNLNKQIRYINNNKFDIIITGSDTVWFKSKKIKNRIPNIYFLPKGISSKKISYAASVDPLNDESYYIERRFELLEIFKNYLQITIRDSMTSDLLEKIGVRDYSIVSDPTLIYSFEKRLRINQNFRKITKVRKIGIGIIDKKLASKVKKILHPYAFEIYDFFTSDKKGTDFLIDELKKYNEFDAIITDRFHRTIFSLKLTRSLTIYIENTNFNKSRNSKGRDLLKNIGLSKYVINSEEKEFDSKLLELIRDYDNKKRENQNDKVEDYIEENKLRIDAIFKHLLS